MQEKILTDNAGELIKVRWDRERFAIVQWYKLTGNTHTVILNPKEMLDLVEFAGKMGRE